MKRNEQIVPLSRDHHAGLLFCWKIRQGIRNQTETERIRQYVLYFWQEHLKTHFREEEELLFSTTTDVLIGRAISEHRILENRIRQVIDNKQINYTLLEEIADLTDNHIRFEERILFPFLESVLPVAVLNSIGNTLRELHKDSRPDNYADAFWTS
jgi:hemerythrin-like domain-containing protein